MRMQFVPFAFLRAVMRCDPTSFCLLFIVPSILFVYSCLLSVLFFLHIVFLNCIVFIIYLFIFCFAVVLILSYVT
ncbi:hypothetical protein WUBG_04897 [Wuchereria bancrofti]|uniref:Uncharacterized protein n=1 Tax=Wuchereria bancrofti TaxID=6293 RepID=J9F3Y7_WUCBA|nr:hypothetical protein WUBG_04897 [Wuchereria bancrofti]